MTCTPKSRASRQRFASTVSDPGDRVAAFMPNIPEAVIAMLAAASIGAVWSSCSPDFGVQGVLDRFGQIEPRILFCADSYTYAGKKIDCLARVRRSRGADSIDRADCRSTLWRRATGHIARATLDVLERICSQLLGYGGVRAASIRSSALHPVFVGHDRTAEMHGARRRRNAASALQGAAPSHRPEAR